MMARFSCNAAANLEFLGGFLSGGYRFELVVAKIDYQENKLEMVFYFLACKLYVLILG